MLTLWVGTGMQCISLINIPEMTNLTCSEWDHQQQQQQQQRGCYVHSPEFIPRQQLQNVDPKQACRFRFPTEADGKITEEQPSVPSTRAPN